MDIRFKEIPALFGKEHLTALLLIVIINMLLYFVFKDKEEKALLKITHYTGLFMMIAEIFKQYFCYVYVFDRQLNLWFFPWQLCSMAMYCAFLVKYFKGTKQEALLVFLATFSLLSDIIALVLPYDMLREQIILFVHSFAYHGLIITLAMLAIMILNKRKDYKFYPAVILFLIMAFIAEIINVVSHHLLNNIYIEPDMFYISPAYPTTQPVFNQVALKFGVYTEIVVYLLSIILGSYLIYLIIRHFQSERKTSKT